MIKKIMFWIWAVVPMVAVIATYSGGINDMFTSEVHAQVPEVKVKTIDKTPEKIEELKADVVKRLTDCENGNFTEDDAPVIWDNNSGNTLTGKNIPSYGELQWKTGTIIDEIKARDSITLTSKEAKLLAFDTPKAQELAIFTIFVHGGKGIEHWYNCSNNPKYFPHGGKAEVEWIKRLEEVIN